MNQALQWNCVDVFLLMILQAIWKEEWTLSVRTRAAPITTGVRLAPGGDTRTATITILGGTCAHKCK
jgi:hypothetical protein